MDTQKPDEVFSVLFLIVLSFFFVRQKNSDPTHRNVRAAEEEVHGLLFEMKKKEYIRMENLFFFFF